VSTTDPATLYAKPVTGVTRGRTIAKTAEISGESRVSTSDSTLPTRPVRADSMSETMLSTSPTMERTASTSPDARGRTRPTTPGTMVYTVSFAVLTMLSNDEWTVGTIEVVTSDATVPVIVESSVATELFKVDTELTTVKIKEDLFETVSTTSPKTPLTSALTGAGIADSTVPIASPGTARTSLVTPLTLRGAARTEEPKLRAEMATVRNCMLIL